MGILEKAISFATDRHAGMVRKGTDVPYIVHPLEAVSIAAGMTNDPEILAAAALHDVVEDTSTTMAELEAAFGNRVAALVASDSEDKMPGVLSSESWETRKKATIATLQDAPLDVKIIVLADKLSNIRSINRDLINIGDAVWERFNQKDKKKHEWYYREIAKALSMGIFKLNGHFSYQEFCWLIDMVFVTNVYEENVTNSQRAEELTKEALRCNPQEIAKSIWWRMLYGATSAYARLDLLRMVPCFNFGEKHNYSTSTADDGWCPDIMRRNNSNEFRWILLKLVRDHMENKAVQIEMKCCFNSDQDGGRDWIRSCFLEAHTLPNSCSKCRGLTEWRHSGLSDPMDPFESTPVRVCKICGYTV